MLTCRPRRCPAPPPHPTPPTPTVRNAPPLQHTHPNPRRHFYGRSEHDGEVPPLLRTALVWGLFMGVSSNLRYQVVFGLERLVDMTVAKRVPQVAYGTTVAIRFVNNVIGAAGGSSRGAEGGLRHSAARLAAVLGGQRPR